MADENPVSAATENNGTIEGHEAANGHPHQLCDRDMAQQGLHQPVAAALCGSGGPTRIEHGGGIDLWDPECAKRVRVSARPTGLNSPYTGDGEVIWFHRECAAYTRAKDHPSWSAAITDRRQALR